MDSRYICYQGTDSRRTDMGDKEGRLAIYLSSRNDFTKQGLNLMCKPEKLFPHCPGRFGDFIEAS